MKSWSVSRKTSNQAFFFFCFCAAHVGFCMRRCVCTSVAERKRAQPGSSRVPLSPSLRKLDTDWLHSTAVSKIKFSLSPTGSNHAAFSLFIPRLRNQNSRTNTHAKTCTSGDGFSASLKDSHCTPGQTAEHYEE